MSNQPFREQVAFTNVKGSAVTAHELGEMAVFLGTDAQDKMYFGGAWGPNFLNDGVIRKDIFETGIGELLLQTYATDFRGDLSSKSEREKRFNLYVNPQVKFIGVESVWNNFAPNMSNFYHVLKVANDPLSKDALNARIGLFMLERQFPPMLLRRVLRYQEQQFKFITPDPALDQIDLSLFGYHTVDDWFGPKFVRLASQFIMNAAVIAEQKGYVVTKDEALADLLRNSEQSFLAISRNVNTGVASSHEYFKEQLRLMGMDQNIAAKVWREVLLFRRMFNDIGNAVLVDPYSLKQMNLYASESIEGQLYRLPKPLRLNNYNALQKLEIYLDAVSKRSDTETAKLSLPTVFLSAAEVGKKTPELVEKRYILDVAKVDTHRLQDHIALKAMWNWETSDAGWEKLKKTFPDVGVLSASKKNDRFAALDGLDDTTRRKIDTFAKESIVAENPDWLEKALADASVNRVNVGLHAKGDNKVFPGLENGEELIALLDAATPNGQNMKDPLKSYSPDKKVYYRITVIDRDSVPEVLTFRKADEQGVLDKLLSTKLEAYYNKIKEEDPKTFQLGDKEWKPFKEVKDMVADRYFEKVLKAIAKLSAEAMPDGKSPSPLLGDYAAAFRFYPYVKEVKGKVSKDAKLIEKLTTSISSNEEAVSQEGEDVLAKGLITTDKLIAKADLSDQWKLERLPYQTARSSANDLVERSNLFQMPLNSWTKVQTPPSGDINFFFAEKKGSLLKKEIVDESVTKVKDLLADQVKKQFADSILGQIREKNAISLSIKEDDINEDGINADTQEKAKKKEVEKVPVAKSNK